MRAKEVYKEKIKKLLSIHFSPIDQASNDTAHHYDRIYYCNRFIMYINSVATTSFLIYILSTDLFEFWSLFTLTVFIQQYYKKQLFSHIDWHTDLLVQNDCMNSKTIFLDRNINVTCEKEY